MLMKFSLLAAPAIVKTSRQLLLQQIMIFFFIKMTTFPFQCILSAKVV